MITINVFNNCTFNGSVFIGLGFVIIILVISLSIKNKVLKKVLKLIDFKCK